MAKKSSAIPSSISSTIQKATGLQMDRSFDQALDTFGKAVQMIQQQRQMDKPLQASKARCHSNMAQIFLQREDWESAHSEFSHSAGIYELLQKPVPMAEALCGMATASSGQGQSEIALQHFHQALDIFQEHKEANLAVTALMGIAEISFADDNTIDALNCLRQVAVLSETPGCQLTALRRACTLAKELEETALLVTLQERQIQRMNDKLEETENLYALQMQVSEASTLSPADQAAKAEVSAEPTATSVSSAAPASPEPPASDDKLEQLIREKNDELRHFINKAAHDMKEPLRMISSFGSLLKSQYGEKLGEGGLEFLAFITDANQRMSVLLQKLLEYVKVGTSDAPIEAVNLDDAVVLVSGDLKSEIEAAGATISTENLPEVQAQREYIKLLFRHLIDNAIKYNKATPPTLHISGEETDEWHIISFADNGIGIEKEQQEKIFEIFIRLHSRSEYPGSGIGLAVAENVMELYGGKIDVLSTPEQGATFRLHFPK